MLFHILASASAKVIRKESAPQTQKTKRIKEIPKIVLSLHPQLFLGCTTMFLSPVEALSPLSSILTELTPNQKHAMFPRLHTAHLVEL